MAHGPRATNHALKRIPSRGGPASGWRLGRTGHGSRMFLYALRYYWRASRGHRLRPWRSPYLRWRLETFFGVPAERLTRQQFFQLLWRERRRVRAFLRWAAEMERRYPKPQ